MIISSIELTNFRNFQHEKIYFSRKAGKNTTIIIGDNSFGKTTIIRAFVWGLYGDNNFTEKNSKERSILLNLSVDNMMLPGDTKEVKVEIVLEHNNCKYKITTTESYTKTTDNILVFNKDTKTVMLRGTDNYIEIPQNRVKNEIEFILKKALYKFFFFEGEKDNFTQFNDKNALRIAIKDILGLNDIEYLRDLFKNDKNGVTGYFNSKIDISKDNVVKELELRKQVTKNENKIEELKKANTDHFSEIENLEKQKENCLRIIEKYESAYEMYMNIERKKLELTQSKEDANTNFEQNIFELNNENFISKFLLSYIYSKGKFKSLANETSYNECNSITKIEAGAIDQLIQRGFCLCGREIKEGNEAYNNLLKELDHIAPKNFYTYIKNYDDILRLDYNLVDEKITDFDNHIFKFLDKMSEISDLKDEINKLNSEYSTEFEDLVDVAECRKSLTEIKSSILYLEKLKKDNSTNINSCVLDNEELYKEIAELGETTIKNEFTKKCITYCDYVYKELNHQVKLRKKDLVKALEEKVNEIYQKTYHGNRTIQIDDDFVVTTNVTGANRQIEHSTGTGKVGDFAFVAGLMNLAKKNMSNLSVHDADHSYPLVMDAPFSNVDQTHIVNVTKTLPAYCDQLILIMMRKDYDIVKNQLSEHIGLIYEIVQENDVNSTIKEVL